MNSIIIPAYNEEENLPFLLDDLLSLKLKDTEIIIVNDNSKDKTPEIAERYSKKYKNISVINRTKGNNGMGFALVEGTKKAKGEIIVWLMADRCDNLETIPRMINKIKSGSDMVFGSRYMKGGSIGDNSKIKALLSGGYTFVASILFRFKVHDIGNAFRAFRKEVFNAVTLNRMDFSISPEFAIKAHILGFKLGEVPTSYTRRKEGVSKFKILKMGWEDVKLFKYLFVNP